MNGQAVHSILLDTGCSRSLVHQDLVPPQQLLEGEAVAIRCAHGDTVLYPLADVKVEVGDHTFRVEAGVSDRLPVSVLLGTDVPGLTDLLDEPTTKHTSTPEDAMIATRAQARQQQIGNDNRARKERQSGAQPHGLDEEEDQKED